MANIEKVDVFRVNLPLCKPMKLASERIQVAENVFVRLTCSDNVVGWGEAASAPTMTGETQSTMYACASEKIAPSIIGQELASFDDLRVLETCIDRSVSANTAAKAAVIMALYDLFARQRKVPMWQLFGDLQRNLIPALLIIGDDDEAEELKQASTARRMGIGHIKIKVGANDPLTDARRVAAIRDLCGWDMAISADANMGWDESQSRVFLENVVSSKLHYLEQPLGAKDVAGAGRLSHLGLMDIAADEGIHDLQDVKHNAQVGVRWFGLKLIKLGGYLPLQEAVDFCHSTGNRTILACKIAESSIGASAMAHFSATVPDLETGVSFTNGYLSQDVVKSPLSITRGQVEVPPGIGHGAEVDIDAVHALQA
ncbi:enolase C-terminal domain-like protein [Paraburkholderia fungorum]|uniref:mandelate racemase/muconate lactonizing enzyme family protein n=1 Tax=Paraburkholderia fungorum TaxID=134537 RepID=UPI0038B6E023